MTWATVAATYPCERGEQRSRTGGCGVRVGPTRAPAAPRVAAAFARACAEAADGPNGGSVGPSALCASCVRRG
jgi:hypothetical protein